MYESIVSIKVIEKENAPSSLRQWSIFCVEELLNWFLFIVLL